MTPADVTHCCALIAGYWPAWRPNDATVFAAERQWADLDRDAVIAAIDSLASEGREHPPPVGVVRNHAVEMLERALGNHVDPDEAWLLVTRRIAAVGFTGGPDPSWPPAVADAVEAVTWWRCCYDENTPTLTAQFREFVKMGASRQARVAAALPSTIGLVEGLAETLKGRARELEP